jgi:photosystem II stability/assembly factor-like uncharacterized protein
VCGFTGEMLRTTNGGLNWINITSGTTNHLMGISFCNDYNGICVGNSGTQLFSNNGGINWSIGEPTGYLVTFYSAFMLNPATGYGVGVNTIFSPLVAKTTNGGLNFTYSSFMVNNNEATLRDVHFFNTQNGIAVSNLWNGTGGISRTTNGGTNWTHQQFPYGIFGLDFPNNITGYCTGYNGYILKSTDGGNNWYTQASGTTVTLNAVDFADSVTGYTVGDGGTILKTTNGGLVFTSNIENQVPDKFHLYQNYPNPFNPVTKIKFEIPNKLSFQRKLESSYTTLKVFNLTGKEVAALVNEQLQPGIYEVTFDGSKLPSGVYFYRLRTDNFTDSRKMLMIK